MTVNIYKTYCLLDGTVKTLKTAWERSATKDDSRKFPTPVEITRSKTDTGPNQQVEMITISVGGEQMVLLETDSEAALQSTLQHIALALRHCGLTKSILEFIDVMKDEKQTLEELEQLNKLTSDLMI